jgi:hypothetical protein
MMTDADGLLAARFAANRDNEDDGDWNEVLRRRQPKPLRDRRPARNGHDHIRTRSLILALVVAVVIAVPAAAFASQIGHFIESLGQREAARNALPDSAVMAVFKRPATSADALPPSALAVLRQFHAGLPAADAINPGVGDLSGARRALVDAGIAHASLYLIPTNKGTLCMVWVPDIGGGCTQGFMPGVDIIFLRGFTNGLNHVWGIARDDVESISAVVDGQIRPVAQGENSFFYEGTSLPRSLILQLANGDKRTVPVAAIPTLRSTTPSTTTGN